MRSGQLEALGDPEPAVVVGIASVLQIVHRRPGENDVAILNQPENDERGQCFKPYARLRLVIEWPVQRAIVKIDEHRKKRGFINQRREADQSFFSANPFVTQDTSRCRMIRPNKSEKVMLPAGQENHVFALPKEYQSANVLVEITGGGLTKAEAAYANELDVQVSEGFGRLQVRHARDKRALSKVYVKVFAE